MSRSSGESLTLPGGTGLETVLYHAADVWITDTRVVIGDRSYRLQDIRSTEVVSVSPAQRLRARLPLIAPLLLYVGFLLFGNFNDSFFAPYWTAFSWIALLALPCMALFTFLQLRNTRQADLYSIRLTGSAFAYTSTDGEYVRWLARQIGRVKEGADSVEELPYSESSEEDSGEYVFYSDGRAMVTSKWLILGGQRIQLENVKKARVQAVPSDTFTRRHSLALTFLFLALILNNFKFNAPNYGRDFQFLFPDDYYFFSLILLVAACATLFWAATTVGSAYIVKLRGSFGDVAWVEVFATFNQAYAKTLANNINSAISARKADIYANNATMPS
ncbi:MAG: DUF6232 family protein [Chloroflexota bacterium]|nr:DUF6232 family protein [Chloroflexota bacterium]MDQ5866028.1 DUF6232 family protein [Chloroflexota bacterium]